MERKDQKHIVILGAGPAGLAAALHALQLGHRVTLVERSDIPGGKGSSRNRGPFTVDYGPHAFHAMSRAVTDIMRQHGGEGFVPVSIVQKLYVTDEPMRYPLEMKEAFLKFSLGLKIKIVSDYMFQRVKSLFVRSSRDSFKSWGVANYGTTLYNICFGDYSRRVWGVDPDTLSVEFAKRKLPALSLGGILGQLITGQQRVPKNDKSYLNVRQFYYHQLGIGKVFAKIAESIQLKGGKIIYQAQINHIRTDDEGRFDLEFKGGVLGTVHGDHLVSTIGLEDLVNYLRPGDDRSSALTQDLPSKHGVIVNIILKRPRLTEAHWVYLVNRRFVFNRLSEPKNFSKHLSPEDKTLIMLETICGADDARWSWDALQWKGLVENDLGFFGVASDEIEDVFLTKMENAYPLYLTGYEKHKKELLERLAKIPHLITTGRYGLYMDINMHDAMVLGASAVDHVVEGRVKEFYQEHEAICLRARDRQV